MFAPKTRACVRARARARAEVAHGSFLTRYTARVMFVPNRRAEWTMAPGQAASSDGVRAAALSLLALHRFDFATTAKATGIPSRTLRNWCATSGTEKKGARVADLLERALSRLLVAIPEQMSGREWSVA